MHLTPQDEDFFALFADQAHLVSIMSGLLLNEVTCGNSARQAVAGRIAELERDGDEMVRRIAISLNHSYRTPIAQEDIRTLSSKLDDVLDGIEDAAHCMAAYHLEMVPGAAVKLCGIIDSCSKVLESAVGTLARQKAPSRQCDEIDRFESEGDTILRSSTASLLGSDLDPITIIKLKELYEMLEDTLDRCRHVADIIRNVVVKAELK